MEKHWSSVVNKSVCDYFFEAQSKASSDSDVPPVISTPHYYLVSIFRNDLYFVAALQSEGIVVMREFCLSISVQAVAIMDL